MDVKATTNMIWTIGHSTHTIEKFVAMLHSFEVKTLVDIRSFPGSRRYPHFNKEALEISLPQKSIKYFHLPELGGRRKAKSNSINTGWRHPAFRGYADYMETENFKNGIKKLQRVAGKEKTAFMCSEALWWRCHRSLVSDYLKVNKWTVIHIMDIAKSEEHRYTSPARIIDGKLSYEEKNLF